MFVATIVMLDSSVMPWWVESRPGTRQPGLSVVANLEMMHSAIQKCSFLHNIS